MLGGISAASDLVSLIQFLYQSRTATSSANLFDKYMVKYKFLTSVLGKTGAESLKKAADVEPAIDAIMVPRAIIGWLGFVSKYEYEGQIPGCDNSYLKFNKNEDSTQFSGSIAIENSIYNFENVSIFHIASNIAVAMGLEKVEVPEDTRDVVLVKLGKSIDTLVRAQEIAKTLHKRLLEKTDLPGLTAQPMKQAGPVEPKKPTVRQPKKTKLPRPSLKPQALKLNTAKSEKRCEICDGTQFANNKFVGCVCYADLAKAIQTTVYKDGMVLEFDKNAEPEVFEAISKYFVGE